MSCPSNDRTLGVLLNFHYIIMLIKMQLTKQPSYQSDHWRRQLLDTPSR